jgi:hypothetical protein
MVPREEREALLEAMAAAMRRERVRLRSTSSRRRRTSFGSGILRCTFNARLLSVRGIRTMLDRVPDEVQRVRVFPSMTPWPDRGIVPTAGRLLSA